jgi:hypothetical protein
MVAALDIKLCERLVGRGAAGDEGARQKLVEHLWPFWLNRVRSRKTLRALSGNEDHVYNVVNRLVAKLLDRDVLLDYERWRAENRSLTFGNWVGTVTDNEVRDYVRAIAGRSKKTGAARDGAGPSVKLLLNEFATSPLLEERGIRPPNTDLQTARELLHFAQGRLPTKQFAALELWLKGATPSELDRDLGLPKGRGTALCRAAVATLRRPGRRRGRRPMTA